MSVLARKRSTAPTEFEMNAARVMKYTVRRCDNIPKRYHKFLHHRLCKQASRAYCDAILANECNSRTEAGRAERRRLLTDGIRAIAGMQKALAVHWSLFDTKDGGVREWAELLNREIVLMNGAAGYEKGEREVPMIHVYDMGYREDRKFIQTVRNLHKYTYSKACSVPLQYKDHLTDQILEFVDDALYCTLEANRVMPKTKAQYEARERLIRRAIRDLNGLQRPLYGLWNVMGYSENTMEEWAEQLNTGLKMLSGVQKSDRKRFDGLS